METIAQTDTTMPDLSAGLQTKISGIPMMTGGQSGRNVRPENKRLIFGEPMRLAVVNERRRLLLPSTGSFTAPPGGQDTARSCNTVPSLTYCMAMSTVPKDKPIPPVQATSSWCSCAFRVHYR